MKSIITTLYLSIISVCISAQNKATTVEFETLTHNFETIEEGGGDVSCTFKFTNTGKLPFVINNIGVSCGCTTPQWTKAPVLPGKSGEITITFDPIGRPGHFEKIINIMGNIAGGSLKLAITGVVNPRPRTIVDDYSFPIADGLRIADRSVAMGEIPRGEITYSALPIANNSDKPLKIEIDSQLLPKYVTAKPAKEILGARERSEIRIKFDATKIDKWGEDEFYYSLIVNNIKQDAVILTRAILVENFKNLTKEELTNAPRSEYSSYFYHFSEQPKGAKLTREFKIRNAGNRALEIRHIGYNNKKLSVEPSTTTIKTGEVAILKVTIIDTKESGAVAETIKIITNDPLTPSRDLRILATIK